MAAVTQPRASGIPQPVSKARGTSRLASMQSQFQQREAAERQKRLAELAPVRAAPSETARPAQATERTTAEPAPRATAPARQTAATRGRVTSGGGAATVSAGGRAAPTGSAASSTTSNGGKVRAMFQTRRAGTATSSASAQQTSPIGWDKSYPLDPIKKSAPARSSAPPPAATKPAAAQAPARARRLEPAAEPRKPATRAAPAPAPARAPPSAAKENRPPAPRPPPTDPNMAQCPICQRQFNKDRLDKHQAICEKSSKKKRKVFDPVKMRVKGTESETYLRKLKNKKPEKEPPKPVKKDWRKQHEEFIRNIRAAKKAQQHLAKGGKLEDLPPPPPMDTSDYVQCPHCSRRFNEAAADRHIPKCASISSNKSKPGAGRSSAAGAKKPALRSSAASRLRR